VHVIKHVLHKLTSYHLFKRSNFFLLLLLRSFF